MGRRGVPLMKPFEHRCSRLNQSFVVLGKESNRSFVSPDNLSIVQKWAVVAAGFPEFSFGNSRGVCQQRIHQSRLTGTVPAHQRNLFSTSHACRELTNYW